MMKKWEKFTRQEIERFVEDSCNFAILADKLGYSKQGGSYLQLMKEMVLQLNLDVSHFTGQSLLSKNTHNSSLYLPFEEYINGDHVQTNKVRKKLLREGIKKHICECCQNTSWMGKPIPLEVHHIDGDKSNNELENLQLLCPNCHSFTDNYKGKNTQKHKKNNFLQEHQDGKPLE